MNEAGTPTEAGSAVDAAAPVRAPVTYLDGTSSRRRNVELKLTSEACEILADDAVIASWPYADIRRADGPTGTLRVMCVSAPLLARLEIRDRRLPPNSNAAVQRWTRICRAPKASRPSSRGRPRPSSRLC